MRITKFVHACLLVEMPDGRTALFDPGSYSTVDPDELTRLDDIFITHNHSDHMDVGLIQRLVAKFPNVRVTATAEGMEQLAEAGIAASNQAPEGATIFDSQHEPVEPLFTTPQEHGIHYLDMFTHPGDSHRFRETKAVLALPVQGPWGSTVNAAQLALDLKPRYIIPIHDWHWNDAARKSTYDSLEQFFKKSGIMFIKAVNGTPFTLDV